MRVGEARRYQRRPELLTRQAPGFVALARVDGTSVRLPGSGAAVWALLDEPRSVAEVGEALTSTYDADAAQIAADVEPLLEQLAESGFVTHV